MCKYRGNKMNLNEKRYCIYGTGGFGREVLACLTDMYATTDYKTEEIAVFMVADEYYTEPKVMGLTVIKESDFSPELYEVVVAIGDPQTRKKVVEKLPKETKYTSIVHPSAVISKWVEVGEGSIITAGTIITCNIRIGRHAHLNLHTTIGHDCIIGDYFTTAPAANISGNCIFEECVYFGTNSSARQGVKICSNVTIGMGGVVVKSIEESGIYIGNPLRKLVK